MTTWKKVLTAVMAAVLPILMFACRSTPDVPVPDDPLAREWTPAIRKAHPSWQCPVAGMPAGNAEYEKALSQAELPPLPITLEQRSEELPPTPPPAVETPEEVTLEMVTEERFQLGGSALSPEDVHRYVGDLAVAAPDTPLTILLPPNQTESAGAAALRDWALKAGLKQVKLETISVDLPVPAAETDKTPAAVTAAAAAFRFGGREVDPAVPAGTHPVVEGDTLSGIAQKVYQSARLWPILLNANSALLKDNPNYLRPGMVLTIPALRPVPGTAVPAAPAEVKAATPETAATPEATPAAEAAAVAPVEVKSAATSETTPAAEAAAVNGGL